MSKAKNENDSTNTVEIPEHHYVCNFQLDKSFCERHSGELEPVLQHLNEMFSAVGTEITVTDSTLTIDILEEKFRSVTTRKAGRKKKKGLDKSLEEINEFSRTHTMQETFDYSGLPAHPGRSLAQPDHTSAHFL